MAKTYKQPPKYTMIGTIAFAVIVCGGILMMWSSGGSGSW